MGDLHWKVHCPAEGKSLPTFCPALLPNPTALQKRAWAERTSSLSVKALGLLGSQVPLAEESGLYPTSPGGEEGGHCRSPVWGIKRPLGAALPSATLRPTWHWGSPASWRGSPECALAPDCPQPAWERAWAAAGTIPSWRGCLEDWHWGPGLLLQPQGSKATGESTVSCRGFSQPSSQAQRHLESPRHIPLPNDKDPEI